MVPLDRIWSVRVKWEKFMCARAKSGEEDISLIGG